MAEKSREIVDRKICEKCGRIHDVPVPDGKGGDEWKVFALCVAGIVLIALIWVWVFRWGVPLVKNLSS